MKRRRPWNIDSHLREYANRETSMMSVEEIAQRLGLSRQRTTQILNSALSKLRRNPMAKELWKDLNG